MDCVRFIQFQLKEYFFVIFIKKQVSSQLFVLNCKIMNNCNCPNCYNNPQSFHSFHRNSNQFHYRPSNNRCYNTHQFYPHQIHTNSFQFDDYPMQENISSPTQIETALATNRSLVTKDQICIKECLLFITKIFRSSSIHFTCNESNKFIKEYYFK